MYCKKCGKKIKETWKYCPNCKLSLQKNNIETNYDNIIKQKKKEKEDSIIYISIFLVSILGFLIFKPLSGYFFVASLISIVTGYMKCPNNKVIKILFVIYCLFMILAILITLYFIFTCADAVSRISCINIW